VDGVLCDSFSAACVARNLVENDQYVRDLLEEGLQHRIHSEVRFLFAHILIHCDPVNPTPLQLWEQYGERMSLDYIGLQHDPVDTALQRSLHHIKHLLGNARKTLADYNLPEPTMNVEWRYRHQNVNLLETTREEYAERVREILPTLNQEQLRAYNAIVNSVENNLPNKLFFIDGPGGTGKTYLINVSGQNIYSVEISGINNFYLVNTNENGDFGKGMSTSCLHRNSCSSNGKRANYSLKIQTQDPFR
jgi:hypothetical protein